MNFFTNCSAKLKSGSRKLQRPPFSLFFFATRDVLEKSSNCHVVALPHPWIAVIVWGPLRKFVAKFERIYLYFRSLKIPRSTKIVGEPLVHRSLASICFFRMDFWSMLLAICEGTRKEWIVEQCGILQRYGNAIWLQSNCVDFKKCWKIAYTNYLLTLFV